MQLNLDFTEIDDIPFILVNKENKKPAALKQLPDNCVIVDIETTGLNPVLDSIIEISALKVMEGKVCGEFSSLVKPEKEIPPFIVKLTGITPEMVKDASCAKTVLKNFCNFVQTNPIVGHNIRFDLSFINNNLISCFKKALPNDFADTLTFARKCYPELASHKLTRLAEHLNISTENAHRALNDCYMTYYLIQNMKNIS